MTRLTTMGELTPPSPMKSPTTHVCWSIFQCLYRPSLTPAEASWKGGPSGASNLEDVRESGDEIFDDADRAGDGLILRVRSCERGPSRNLLGELRDVVKDVLALAL